MTAEARKFAADSLRRQHEVDAAQAYGSARHTGEMGRFIVLRESDAAFAFDLLHRQCAVRTATRQDNADGVSALVFGKGVQ